MLGIKTLLEFFFFSIAFDVGMVPSKWMNSIKKFNSIHIDLHIRFPCSEIPPAYTKRKKRLCSQIDLTKFARAQGVVAIPLVYQWKRNHFNHLNALVWYILNIWEKIFGKLKSYISTNLQFVIDLVMLEIKSLSEKTISHFCSIAFDLEKVPPKWVFTRILPQL